MFLLQLSVLNGCLNEHLSVSFGPHTVDALKKETFRSVMKHEKLATADYRVLPPMFYATYFFVRFNLFPFRSEYKGFCPSFLMMFFYIFKSLVKFSLVFASEILMTMQSISLQIIVHS